MNRKQTINQILKLERKDLRLVLDDILEDSEWNQRSAHRIMRALEVVVVNDKKGAPVQKTLEKVATILAGGK